jgi:hypothetical protein
MKRPKTFSELIAVIDSKRPLYTGRSISCLRSFFDGWLFGSDPAPDQTFANFEASLQKRHGLGNISWDRILLLYASDECEAYETFFDEFKKFLHEQPPT